MAVYEILEEIMSERDVSIADIARMCNLPDSTVRGIVRRKQDSIALEVAFKLSDGLGVSLEKLNGMPEKENSSGPVGSDPEEEISRLFDKLNDVLVSSRFIRDGEDITDEQANVLLGICRIINATFKKHT